jgi:hypothetical protein
MRGGLSGESTARDLSRIAGLRAPAQACDYARSRATAALERAEERQQRVSRVGGQRVESQARGQALAAVALDGAAAEYAAAVLALPAMVEWREAALAEGEIIAAAEPYARPA